MTCKMPFGEKKGKSWDLPNLGNTTLLNHLRSKEHYLNTELYIERVGKMVTQGKSLALEPEFRSRGFTPLGNQIPRLQCNTEIPIHCPYEIDLIVTSFIILLNLKPGFGVFLDKLLTLVDLIRARLSVYDRDELIEHQGILSFAYLMTCCFDHVSQLSEEKNLEQELRAFLGKYTKVDSDQPRGIIWKEDEVNTAREGAFPFVVPNDGLDWKENLANAKLTLTLTGSPP